MPLYRIHQLKLPLDHEEAEIGTRIRKLLRLTESELLGFTIDRKSFDARDRGGILVVYAVTVELRRPLARAALARGVSVAEPRPAYAFPAAARRLEARPLVVGSGPAGYFCALILAENGYRPIVLERGEAVEARSEKVGAFFASGRLDPESNVQFGEGGAGTYSDGKLTSSASDAAGRNAKVIEEFIAAGAPDEIAYMAKPHIGTDRLIEVVRNIRRKIESLGGEVHFGSRVDSLLVEDGRIAGAVLGSGEELRSRVVVLAVGHSARDTFGLLASSRIAMERKAFAIGLRIEHPQERISRNQFGPAFGHPRLPVADYRLATRSADGRGVYSFCMCPGGYVVNSSSEHGMVVCNGMSDFARDSPNANSAIVVTVRPEDFGDGGVLAGVEFQRRWEGLAFEAGGGDMSMPLQRLGDFLAGRPSTALGSVVPAARGRYALASLNACLPGYVVQSIKGALLDFDRIIGGFADPDALLSGVETRTSSPVRILRDEGLEASVGGLYPCGEGAGYAGGIMSSAMDGLRVAEAIARSRS